MSKTREAQSALNEFDRYFTSMNCVDVDARISVPRDEWRVLRGMIEAALAEPEQEPVTMHKVAEERDKLMQMVQEYASTWAIVGGRFDDGSAFEDAKKSKDSIFRQTAKLATISFELGFDKERGVAPSPQPLKTALEQELEKPTEDVINHAVNRFLGWKLPREFSPDNGIVFKLPRWEGFPLPTGWPIGTNLLTADQAKSMFEHCLEGATLYTSPQPQWQELSDETRRELFAQHSIPVEKWQIMKTRYITEPNFTRFYEAISAELRAKNGVKV